MNGLNDQFVPHVSVDYPKLSAVVGKALGTAQRRASYKSGAPPPMVMFSFSDLDNSSTYRHCRHHSWVSR